MNFSGYKHIYFLGIGGIGMSALARYFRSQGKYVSGYDKTPTPLTDELQNEGIPVHFEDAVGRIDKRITDNDKGQTLVVYTPAIPAESAELNFLKTAGFPVRKRSEVLGMITENSYTVAVAGTHGKTTTSSMIAHILKATGVNSLAFLGGITKNYNSNLLLPTDMDAPMVVIVEADEYDRSFLTLTPSLSVITSMDPDHLDVYGDENYMVESYRLFAGKLRQNGVLIYKKGLPLSDLPLTMRSYTIAGEADYSASNIRISGHRYRFDWKNSATSIEGLAMQMPGLHNVENAVAAIAVAKQLQIPDEDIKGALLTYTGVRRRFDYQLQSPAVVFIDDYAHHPEELRACISSARELYPGKKITGIFQPHLYTRTRDFAAGFAASLSLLDTLLLLDIYPARELPIPGITSKIIFDRVTIADKVLCRKEAVIDELKKRKCEIVLTLGAGDIDQLVNPLNEYLKNIN
jgi:UDP-N-acetylmuramate--alanine ligase